MKPESIDKIDQLLEELENIDDAQLPERRLNFLNSVCDAVNLPPDELFNSTNGPHQKKFIAICLLRLLCRNENAIWKDMDLRINTFNLFDNQIRSIYHNLNIIDDDQNHEKLEKLLGTEGAVLANFSDITDSIVSLDMLPSIRQNFMSKLNFHQNKLFLEQFVTPSSLINTERINLVFETAQAYNESSMEDLVISYHNLEAVFNSFLDAAAKNPSIFTERCIVAPVKKIYDFIQDDFKSNDAIQPAKVTLSSLDRKYPFHLRGKRVELKFRMENQGLGYAFDVQVECIDIDKGLKLCNSTENFGLLAPRRSSDIVFEIVVEDNIEGSPGIIGQISWRNYDNSRQSNDFDFELYPQRTDLNWDELKLEQPYSLEAISKVENLVGRTELIGRLRERLSANQIESSIIYGQKRVGKTSVAEVVQAEFEKKEIYTVIFISIGDLDKITSERFVANLGNRIVRMVSRASKSFAGIEKPSFDGALSPLVEYFEDAIDILPEHKFIVILDEFDEIPLDMVGYSNVSDTFFHNIRSISGHVGFVLVGGENMQIITQSTDRLNKMEVLRVDYFDKGQYWKDFQELVRRPVTGRIEFNDEAINALYEMTEGNPFYTKYICRKIYTQACSDRNPYISEDNVEQAIQAAIEELNPNQVNHFWKDGIFVDDPAQRDQIETQRRKFLLAFAQIKRNNTPVSKQDLQNSEILSDVAVDQIIESYTTRGILIEEVDHYRWKPQFFERWLVECGYSMITTAALDENAIEALMTREQEAYVRDQEIIDLDFERKLYRGSEITALHIRAWLDQFEDNTQKRLMFNLLQHVRFYDDPAIREKIRSLHERIQAEITEMGGVRAWDKRYRRGDILLSSFGAPSKSASSYARIYRMESNIFVDNVVHFDQIQKTLQTNEQIKAIVFVDDIIGSGGSALKPLNQLNTMCGELIHNKQVTIFISAICGLDRGIKELEKAIKKVPFDAKVVVSDSLTEVDQCFTDQSEVFSSPSERERAKQIAWEYGKKLKERPPLGYRNSQLLVAFYDNCPNNTLPILWKESTGKVKWTPLFKRN